jgi:hypothetical protein
MTFLTLWSYMKELLKLVHRWRKHHLVVWTGRQIENRNPNKLTDDLGINSSDVAINSGLEDRPMLIILCHLQVGIEKANKPSENNTGASGEISPLILLDSLIVFSGATIKSARTTFRSAMTVRSMILAFLSFTLASVFLRTRRCELMSNMILHEGNQQEYSQK